MQSGGMYHPSSLRPPGLTIALSCSFSIALSSRCTAIVADGDESIGDGIRSSTSSFGGPLGALLLLLLPTVALTMPFSADETAATKDEPLPFPFAGGG
ncbi:hypothetical protein FB451DRAFT_1397806 [Mycena latifolia]|nr:hypothetical protein FB451DRAFT_1397806 [Mycena latifolia]